MPIVNVRDIGTIGVISDIAPWDLPPGALTDGMNFRASAGKIQAAGGLREAKFQTPIGDELGHLSQAVDLDNNSSWLLYGEKTITEWDGVSTRSILGSMSLNVVDSSRWSSCHVGAQTFMNHPNWYPMSWLDLDNVDQNDCQILPWGQGQTWQDASMSTNVIRSH